MKIQVEGLTKHFGKTKAVDGITFSFSAGQVFGFVGPNGAGKTTTMRILATLDEPTSGRAFIGDYSVLDDVEEVRRLVGYMPDYLPDHIDITVHEYLDFYARAYGLRGVKCRKAVETVEEFTGLTGIREKVLKALSKGMKQRVSLGRAMIHDPFVLILDEPANGLDPRARMDLRELVGILAAQKKAILISSHILTELTEICNGVIIIEQGKLLDHGIVKDIAERVKPLRMIILKTIGQAQDACRALLEMPGVSNARQTGDEVCIDFDGSEEASSTLLCDLVKRGIKVSEFRHNKANLEDIFMSVTKGGVQ